MKKITSLILAFVMAVTLAAGSGITVKADVISVTKNPIPAIVDVMKVSDLIQLIKDNAGSVTSNGSTSPITPDMCYLYCPGGKIGIMADGTAAPAHPVGEVASVPLATFTGAVQGMSLPQLAACKYTSSNWYPEPYLAEGNYSVVVRYNNGTETLRFTVSKVTGIQWPDKLTKTEYFVGDTLDTTGDNVTLVHNNGLKSTVPITPEMLYTIAATYGSGAAANTEGLNENCYKLGYNFNTAAAGQFDIVIKYPQKYQSDISSTTRPSGANRLYIDSSFKAGYFIANRGVADPTQLGAVDLHATNGNVYNKDTIEAITTAWPTVTDIIASSPESLNGTKVYRINVTNALSYAPKIRYKAHVQNIGWQGWFYSPNQAGTDHQSLRMEALQIQITNPNTTMGGIEYMGHIQNQGDTEWITADKVLGTEGKSLRMEGVAIRFTGKYADNYSISYRVHVQGIGWMPWVKDGEYAGTRGELKRMEAIEIQVTAK